MYFHVDRNEDNLLDVSFYSNDIIYHHKGIEEDELDSVVFSRSDSAIMTQILVPYETWDEMGRPKHLTQDIQCH